MRNLTAKQNPRRLGGVILFSCVLLAFIACGVYFGPQTLFWLTIRRGKIPSYLYISPRPLPVTTLATGPLTILSYFNYRFEAPWTEVVKESNEGRWARVEFRSGTDVFFTNPDRLQNDVQFRCTSDSSEPTSSSSGGRPNGDKYSRLETFLTASPFELNPFMRRGTYSRVKKNLECKGIYLEHSGVQEVFYVRTARYRGFEVSSIRYNRRVSVVLFDETGREFNIVISCDQRCQTEITQPQVNTIIESLEPEDGGTLNASPY